MDRLDRYVNPVSNCIRVWAFPLFLIAAIATAITVRAQQAPVPEVSVPIVVSTDAGDAETLTFGYDPDATDSGFDDRFLEKEWPPPAFSFDARLICESGVEGEN
jgi:hypothetical protein